MTPEKEKILEANASAWRNRAQRAEAELEKLRAFKAYVHARLDEANVPPNPDPEKNKEHGCRVEGRLNFLVAQRDRCERYGLASLPGVEFCRKGGARIVAEKLEDLRAELAKVTAERDAAVERAKTEIARKQWVTERIEAELRRAGIELQWTDGGGAACPGGWHRNPYLNVGNIADVSRDLAAAQATAAQHEKALETTRARCAMLTEGLADDQPWSVPSMLDNLGTAALHLVKDHDCDRHGWEEVTGNIARVRVAAAKLRAALSAPDAGVAEWLEGVKAEAQVTAKAVGLRLYSDLIHVLNGVERELEPGAKASLATHDAQVEAKVQRKLDDLAERYKALEAQSAEQRRQLAAVRTDRDNVWLWQGDGNDRPSSLACPVVMTPDTLRDLLANVLEKYGDHTRDCDVNHNTPESMSGCNCGFERAIDGKGWTTP